jgi:hypothetical protein
MAIANKDLKFQVSLDPLMLDSNILSWDSDSPIIQRKTSIINKNWESTVYIPPTDLNQYIPKLDKSFSAIYSPGKLKSYSQGDLIKEPQEDGFLISLPRVNNLVNGNGVSILMVVDALDEVYSPSNPITPGVVNWDKNNSEIMSSGQLARLSFAQSLHEHRFLLSGELSNIPILGKIYNELLDSDTFHHFLFSSIVRSADRFMSRVFMGLSYSERPAATFGIIICTNNRVSCFSVADTFYALRLKSGESIISKNTMRDPNNPRSIPIYSSIDKATEVNENLARLMYKDNKNGFRSSKFDQEQIQRLIDEGILPDPDNNIDVTKRLTWDINYAPYSERRNNKTNRNYAVVAGGICGLGFGFSNIQNFSCHPSKILTACLTTDGIFPADLSGTPTGFIDVMHNAITNSGGCSCEASNEILRMLPKLQEENYDEVVIQSGIGTKEFTFVSLI